MRPRPSPRPEPESAPFRPLEILAKIRSRGVGWLWRRLVKEWHNPETTVGKRIQPFNRALVSALERPLRLLQPGGAVDPGAMVLFYDLDVSPITFDFLWALAAAEMRRQELGLESVHVVIVPGRQDGLREEMAAYDAVVDRAARQWRLHHLVFPACTLLPICGGFTVAPSRAWAARLVAASKGRHYPLDYHPTFPTAHRVSDCLDGARGERSLGVLSAPAHALRLVDDWLTATARGRRVICIPLRNYGYSPERNSNIPAWRDFARSLDDSRYLPVFVPDTEQALVASPELQGLTLFPAAAVNLHLRAALNQRAWATFGVSSGPMALSWFIRECRYATFRLQTRNSPATPDSYFRQHGFDLHGDLPGARPWQRWIWEDDDLETINRVFRQMEGVIPGGPGGGAS